MGAETSKLDLACEDSFDPSQQTLRLPLTRLIRRRDWSAVLSRVRSHPRDAAIRLDSVLIFGRPRSNVTPLHLAAALGAPAEVVDALLEACPDAARVQIVNSVETACEKEQQQRKTKEQLQQQEVPATKSKKNGRRGSITMSVANFLMGGGGWSDLNDSGGSDCSNGSGEGSRIGGSLHSRSVGGSLHSRKVGGSLHSRVSIAPRGSVPPRRSSLGYGLDDDSSDESDSSWDMNIEQELRQLRGPSQAANHAPRKGSGGRDIGGNMQKNNNHPAKRPYRRSSLGQQPLPQPSQRRHSSLGQPLPQPSQRRHSSFGQPLPQPPQHRNSSFSEQPLPQPSQHRHSSFGQKLQPQLSERRHSFSNDARASSGTCSAVGACSASTRTGSQSRYRRSDKSFRGLPNQSARADLSSSDWLPLHVAVLFRAPTASIRSLVLAHPWGAKVKNGMGMLPIHIVCADMEPPRVNAFRRSSDGGADGAARRRASTSSPWDVAEVVTLLIRAFPESVHVCSSNADGMTPLQYAEENMLGGSAGAGSSDMRHRTKANIIHLLRIPDITKIYPPITVPEEQGRNGRQVVHSFQGKKDCPASITTGRKMFSMGNRDDEQQVPRLYALISTRKWKAAIRRVGKCPEEASIWTMCDDGGSANSDGSQSSFAGLGGNGGVSVHRLPLHLALSLNAPADVVEALIGAYPESLAARQEFGVLPIHAACHYWASFDVVESILRTHPAGASARDTFGNLPVHVACGRAAPVCVVRALLAAYPEGAKAKDGKGRSPTERAIGSGHPDAQEIATLCGCFVGQTVGQPSLENCVSSLSPAKKPLCSLTA